MWLWLDDIVCGPNEFQIADIAIAESAREMRICIQFTLSEIFEKAIVLVVLNGRKFSFPSICFRREIINGDYATQITGTTASHVMTGYRFAEIIIVRASRLIDMKKPSEVKNWRIQNRHNRNYFEIFALLVYKNISYTNDWQFRSDLFLKQSAEYNLPRLDIRHWYAR